jgi:hypothetical protein
MDFLLFFVSIKNKGFFEEFKSLCKNIYLLLSLCTQVQNNYLYVGLKLNEKTWLGTNGLLFY